MTPRVGVAVPAAGAGRRMGGHRKPWLDLLGEPLLLHALRPFLDHPHVTAVVVALASDEAMEPPRWLSDLTTRAEGPRVRVVAGGETRAHSVREAVRALPEDVEVILVHDAARPLVTGDIIDRCAAAALDDEGGTSGAVAGWPATDTLKQVDEEGRVVSTPDRSRVWHAQTPQGFPARSLRAAYERLEDAGPVTDDASLVEAFGGRVRMVRGGPWNLKVTRPEDVAVAELLLERARAGAPAAPQGTPLE